MMKANDFSQGIVIGPEPKANLDLRKGEQSRILRAFGFTAEDIKAADKPCLFDEVEVGQAFLTRTATVCYVSVRLNHNNAGGGDNSVVIGGIYPLFGGWHDFYNGSVVVGFRKSAVVYPIPGKQFDRRERRALKNA